ncbi:hypothetical protein [Kitasatospora griseola]
MADSTQPVTVDAEQLIVRLRAQMSEAWGQTQSELAFARTEIDVRAARENELHQQLEALKVAAAEKDRTIAELRSTLAALQQTSTRP